VNSKPPRFDQAFLHRQRQRLMQLREQLLRSIRDAQSEERGVHAQSVGEAHEFEEDAQKLAMLENEQNLIDRSRQRLRDIERALQKIEDGSYGRSDSSGEPIPRERLEAVPEAIATASEAKKR
jgi:RNA polymerase-binding transcription factor